MSTAFTGSSTTLYEPSEKRCSKPVHWAGLVQDRETEAAAGISQIVFPLSAKLAIIRKAVYL